MGASVAAFELDGSNATAVAFWSASCVFSVTPALGRPGLWCLIYWVFYLPINHSWRGAWVWFWAQPINALGCQPYDERPKRVGVIPWLAIAECVFDFPLEGSLFNDQAVFTLSPNRWRNRFEIGITFHNQQWKLQSTLLSSSKDTASQRDPRHEFLNISISRFFSFTKISLYEINFNKPNCTFAFTVLYYD